jgi:hypothetical protein
MKLRQYPLLCALILLNCAQSGNAQSEPTSIADVAPQIDTAERIIDAVAAAEANIAMRPRSPLASRDSSRRINHLTPPLRFWTRDWQRSMRGSRS